MLPDFPNGQDQIGALDVFAAKPLVLGVNSQTRHVDSGGSFLQNRKARTSEHPQPLATLDPIEVLHAVFAPELPL